MPGISPHCPDQVDEQLTVSLLSNIPQHGFPLLSIPCHPGQQQQQQQFPTLLHWAAAHGLERLSCALLDCPGARTALVTTNNRQLGPSEVRD